MGLQNGAQCLRELTVCGRDGSWGGVDEICPSGLEKRGVLAHCGAKPTPHAVAYNGITDRSADRERDARRVRARRDEGRAHLERARSATAPMHERPEHRAVTNAPDQAERLERPLPRRRPMTARPPRVRIRIRKPCVFFRFRLFGWNVLFTHASSNARGRGRGPRGGRAAGFHVCARKWTRQCTPDACTRQCACRAGKGCLLACPQRASVPFPASPAGPGTGSTSPSWPRSGRPSGSASPHMWKALWTTGSAKNRGVDRGYSSGR